MNIKNQKGTLIIEVLVSISIAVVFSLAISTLVSANNKLVTISEQETLATALAKESIEQVFAIKQDDWSKINSLAEGDYLIQINGNEYEIVLDETGDPGEIIDDFYNRRIIINDIYRNEIGEISASGDIDPQTRFVEVIVDWEYKEQQKEVVLQSIITNWKGDI